MYHYCFRKQFYTTNMKELRDIKIDLLTGNNNKIVDLFNQITNGIEIIRCNVYDNHGKEFIYHKNGKWIFYQDCKNDKFWCNYTKYWSLFQYNLELEHKDIKDITKYLVEEELKVATPTAAALAHGLEVEEALKREVATPQEVSGLSMVEEALKREVKKKQRT